MTQILRSPVPWMGGKHLHAQRIIKAFPLPESYDVYVELCGGGANVLLQKPPYSHLEVYNDVNGDLVNFWLMLRNHPEEIEQRLDTLPYSRTLYYQYHASLFDGTELEPIERAVRWFYVLHGSFRAAVTETPSGWKCGVVGLHKGQKGEYAGQLHAHILRRVTDLFPRIVERFRYVEIECADFEPLIRQYQKHRTLFYIDPPYIGAEHYYGKPFDHERLAYLLNTTTAYVVLSYYPHKMLEEWYPESKWRRMAWKTPKHSQRTKDTHDIATEMLLCNYLPVLSLWQEGEVSA